MKFNRSNLFVIISFIIVAIAVINAGYFYLEAEAQQGANIEKYTEADKDVKFQRLQFELYFLASDIGDGNNFLNGIETQRANKILKSLPIKSNVHLWCVDDTFGEIYRVSGAYVFKTNQDAADIKTWLENNLPINKIRYAEFYLLENNHHWDKPTTLYQTSP